MNIRSGSSLALKNVGVYTWALVGFSEVSCNVGDIVESPEFTVCDKVWQLRIFPGGSLPPHAGFLSFYLASKAPTVTRAAYKLMILAQVLGEVDEVFVSSGVRKFEARGKQVDGWGRDKFMSQEALKSPLNGFLKNDTIIFRVEIHASGQTCLSHYPDDRLLTDEFLNMREGPFTDLIVRLTGGKEPAIIKVNKCVLVARSSVFKCMLTNQMMETDAKEVILPDDAVVFEEFLHYTYTGVCTKQLEDVEFTRDLLATASKYQVQGLISLCEHHLSVLLTLGNCIQLLIFADSIYAQELKKNALQFIARHFEELENEEEYTLLDTSFQEEVNTYKKSVSRRFFRGSYYAGGKESTNNKICAIS